MTNGCAEDVIVEWDDCVDGITDVNAAGDRQTAATEVIADQSQEGSFIIVFTRT